MEGSERDHVEAAAAERCRYNSSQIQLHTRVLLSTTHTRSPLIPRQLYQDCTRKTKALLVINWKTMNGSGHDVLICEKDCCTPEFPT